MEASRWNSLYGSYPYDGGSKTFEVQRQNNFEVHILGLITASGGSATDYENTLVFATEQFPLPNESNEETSLQWGNRTIKVAGKATYDSGQMTLKDFIGADTELLIHNWRRTVYNPLTDQVGWAADYKKDALIYEFSPDGSVGRIWRVKGMWPQQANFGQLDQSSGDKKQMDITLSYDFAFRVDNAGSLAMSSAVPGFETSVKPGMGT